MKRITTKDDLYVLIDDQCKSDECDQIILSSLVVDCEISMTYACNVYDEFTKEVVFTNCIFKKDFYLGGVVIHFKKPAAFLNCEFHGIFQAGPIAFHNKFLLEDSVFHSDCVFSEAAFYEEARFVNNVFYSGISFFSELEEAGVKFYNGLEILVNEEHEE